MLFVGAHCLVYCKSIVHKEFDPQGQPVIHHSYKNILKHLVFSICYHHLEVWATCK